jgi:hypothetical protein
MTLPPPPPPPRPRPVDPCVLRGRGSDEVDPGTTDPTRQDPAGEVERALGELDGLGERPLAEHVGVFERIHTALQDALAAGSGAGEAAGRT